MQVKVVSEPERIGVFLTRSCVHVTDISCGVSYGATLASLVLFRSYCYVVRTPGSGSPEGPEVPGSPAVQRAARSEKLENLKAKKCKCKPGAKVTNVANLKCSDCGKRPSGRGRQSWNVLESVFEQNT